MTPSVRINALVRSSRTLLLAGLVAPVCLVPAELRAGQLFPRLTGNVEIELTTGGITGDVCLTGIPISGDTAVVVLNRSLSIDRVRGAADEPIEAEAEPGGATMRYAFTGAVPRTDEGSGESVADICFEYSGDELVYDVSAGQYREEDGSQVIAFSGTTVRARGSSRWYPTPQNRRTGMPAEAVAFAINVRCIACKEIYVNGGEVTSGPDATFTSEVPRELLLIAGTLSTATSTGLVAASAESPTDSVADTVTDSIPDTVADTVAESVVEPLGRPFVGSYAADHVQGEIIGEEVDPETTSLFVGVLAEIREFLEGYLDVPYGSPPDIVRIDDIDPPGQGEVWAFFSDPALILIGMTIPQIADVLTGPVHSTQSAVLGLLAHELGHRYFGWTLGAGSLQRDLYGEPFAMYLELKAIRHFQGEAEYRGALRRLAQRVGEGPAVTPLDRAGPADFASYDYRYGYALLMLFSLEDVIGEEKMRSLLKQLLTATPAEQFAADYDFLARSAERAGVLESEWERWEALCVDPPLEENTCLARIAD